MRRERLYRPIDGSWSRILFCERELRHVTRVDIRLFALRVRSGLRCMQIRMPHECRLHFWRHMRLRWSLRVDDERAELRRRMRVQHGRPQRNA